MVFVVSPWLTYKYGKRWYCSWVCGCGGLAETAGDSFRHLSDKGIKAWKLERWMINSVLVFSVVMTVATISTYLGYDSDKYWFTKNTFLISVGTFLTLVFAGVFYFKRKDLDKGAVQGALGFFALTLGFLFLIGFVDLNGLQINAKYFSFGLNQNSYGFDGALRSFYAFGIGSIEIPLSQADVCQSFATRELPEHLAQVPVSRIFSNFSIFVFSKRSGKIEK